MQDGTWNTKNQRCSSGIKGSFIKSDVSIYCVFDCITEQLCAVRSEMQAQDGIPRKPRGVFGHGHGRSTIVLEATDRVQEKELRRLAPIIDCSTWNMPGCHRQEFQIPNEPDIVLLSQMRPFFRGYDEKLKAGQASLQQNFSHYNGGKCR
jgi:hypothetical protein